MKTYSTRDIEEVIENFNNGVSGSFISKKITDIFYRRDLSLKNGDMAMQYTNDEMQEWAKCKHDPMYFFEKYCKITTHNGTGQSIKLRGYQIELINDYFNNRFNITACSRQVGITMVISLLMLYELSFEYDKAVVVLSNRLDTSSEKLDRVKEMYQNLPFFLKPGVVEWTKTKIVFNNGCRGVVGSGKSLTRGYNIHSLFIDDYAFMHNGKDIFRGIYPSMAAHRNARIFISSTPNGINHFYELYNGASRKDGDPAKNMFVAHSVYWWEVPGRDAEWREREIVNLGSEAFFNQSYDLQFFQHKERETN